MRSRSRRRFQPSTYLRSSRIHSSKDIRYRSGQTCHKQVSPGRTANRRYCHCSYLNTSLGSDGRGPTDAHLAAENVQQLRQLVQRVPPDEPANAVTRGSRSS